MRGTLKNSAVCFLFRHSLNCPKSGHLCEAKTKNMLVNFNGTLLPADQPIFGVENRAFRYGDGLFESIRVFDGKTPFLERHWQRLAAGLALLRLAVPGHFSLDFFENEIAKLTERAGNWRIRLTVWRNGGGLYTPEGNLPEFLIQATPLPTSRFELNEQGLTIGLFQTVRLTITPSQNLVIPQGNLVTACKTTSALPFVLASIFKKEKQLDDCLVLNTAGRLACASSANIFLVKNGKLYTPPLSEGCIAGTMRAEVISLAKSLKINVVEKKIHPASVDDFDAFFLTNAMQGIRWVRKINGAPVQFGNDLCQLLTNGLNHRIQG
jgi:branched-chain amino acid aminotransferase